MIVGVFSPAINLCGGAEWVALNIIDALKAYGHQVILLSDNPLNQKKIAHVFNRKVVVDQELILPLRFFSSSNFHNVYTDVLRTLTLKSKCKVLIDTHSNAALPGVDAAYIHYPLLASVKQGLPYFRNKIYLQPYKCLLGSRKNAIANMLLFANSKFTAHAVRAEFGVKPYLLYPSVSSDVFDHNKAVLERHRDNNVTTIARISYEKNLEIIPYIAKLTSKEISFTIAGQIGSEKVLNSLLNLVKELNVSEKVKILTNPGRDHLRRILLNSKVLLHTMEKEHFGIAIVEAMSLGCIPVVHDSGGPREFVSQAFRFKSIEDAVAKIEKAIDYWSPTQAKLISKRAERFSENNFSKQFTEIFNSHFRESK